MKNNLKKMIFVIPVLLPIILCLAHAIFNTQQVSGAHIAKFLGIGVAITAALIVVVVLFEEAFSDAIIEVTGLDSAEDAQAIDHISLIIQACLSIAMPAFAWLSGYSLLVQAGWVFLGPVAFGMILAFLKIVNWTLNGLGEIFQNLKS